MYGLTTSDQLINFISDQLLINFFAFFTEDHNSWSANQVRPKYAADKQPAPTCGIFKVATHFEISIADIDIEISCAVAAPDVWASHIQAAVIINNHWSRVIFDHRRWGEPRTFRQGGRYALLRKVQNLHLVEQVKTVGDKTKGCRCDSTRTIALKHQRQWRVAP